MNNLATVAVINYYMMMSTTFLEISKRKSRRWWVREIFKNREKFGDSYNLVNEMMLTDRESFFNFTRMSFEQFDLLLLKVGPKIQKTSIRKSIPPRDRLLITLR